MTSDGQMGLVDVSSGRVKVGSTWIAKDYATRKGWDYWRKVKVAEIDTMGMLKLVPVGAADSNFQWMSQQHLAEDYFLEETNG